ncbi:MAG: tetratricopeptide (TPR) repeat protein [Bradymonadia bacterium]|jgi:tetratricopeptide (TPR) repeat protein
MTRLAPIVLAGALASLLAAIALPPTALAQDLGAQPTGPAMLVGTPDEKAAQTLVDQGKQIEAREAAQKILKIAPKSFIGRYVMCEVFYRLEANLPRALFLVRQVRRELEAEVSDRPNTQIGVLWHKRLIKLESWILSDMDDREGQLTILDYFNARYQPPREVHKMWPLLKLQRFDEALEIGERLIFSEREWERRRAYNGLMAVEDERRNRKASYEWGLKAYAVVRGKSCIINTNLALAARRAFELENAERYDKEAIKATDGSCPTSPYAQLTMVYLAEGEFQKSLSALEKLRQTPREPNQRIQNEMTIKGRLAELLYALGQFKQAADRTHEIMRHPDRAGTTSASEESIELSNAVLHAAVVSGRLEQLRERAGVRGFGRTLDVWSAMQSLMVERWQIKRRAIRLGALESLLVDIVSPYYTDVMPWYGAAMIDLFGEGVILKMVAAARTRDVDYPDRANGFYDATEGELAWRAGDWGKASALGTQALEGLPKRVQMLRWRIMTWLADAAFRGGDTARAQRLFHEVMRNQPTALRHLGVKLPAKFVHSGGALAAEAVARLQGSPRFGGAPLDFTVRVTQEDDIMQLCMLGVGGQQYGCHVAREGLVGDLSEEQAEDGLLAALDAFHDEAFSPKLELTQTDINSLDGRAVRQSASDAIEGLLGKEVKDAEPIER